MTFEHANKMDVLVMQRKQQQKQRLLNLFVGWLVAVVIASKFGSHCCYCPRNDAKPFLDAQFDSIVLIG